MPLIYLHTEEDILDYLSTLPRSETFLASKSQTVLDLQEAGKLRVFSTGPFSYVVGHPVPKLTESQEPTKALNPVSASKPQAAVADELGYALPPMDTSRA